MPIMAHTIALRPLVSSSIVAAGYDREQRTLRLCYIGGATYDYQEVPAEVFADLLNAPSKGRFVNTHVKPRFTYLRVS
jgi:hypothetical protein